MNEEAPKVAEELHHPADEKSERAPEADDDGKTRSIQSDGSKGGHERANDPILLVRADLGATVLPGKPFGSFAM